MDGFLEFDEESFSQKAFVSIVMILVFITIFSLWAPTFGLYDSCTDHKVEYLTHQNCAKFYQCSHGIPLEKSCPLGTMWSKQRSACDWPHRVSCNRGTTKVWHKDLRHSHRYIFEQNRGFNKRYESNSWMWCVSRKHFHLLENWRHSWNSRFSSIKFCNQLSRHMFEEQSVSSMELPSKLRLQLKG